MGPEHLRTGLGPRSPGRPGPPARTIGPGVAHRRRRPPVTAWSIAAVALLLGLLPLLFVAVTAETMSRIVALEVAGVNAALALVLVAQHFSRSFYADEAIVLATLSLAGGLLLVRVLERWL